MTPVNKLFSESMGRRISIPQAIFQDAFYAEWVLEEMAGNPLDAPEMLPTGGLTTVIYVSTFEQPAVPRAGGW